jgi:diadenosine tetraphosphate (Ap4A) HIT family hydrolase
VVPSGKTSRNFQFEWDPNGDWDAGRERNVTKLQAATLLRAVRSKLSLRSTEPLNNVLWDTGLITAELVQRPSSIGHFMVSPKELSPDLEDCARLDCGACLWVVPKIAQAMVQTMRTKDFVICLLNGPESGQLFPHLTFQVVPFSNRKVAVTFDTVAKVHMSEDQSFALCNALRQVIGEDQLSTAMRMEVAPLESAWDRPPSRPSVSRAGVSSPYVDRGRAPPATIEVPRHPSPPRRPGRPLAPEPSRRLTRPPTAAQDWAVARVPTEDVDPQRLARRASGNSGLTMRAAGGDPRGVFAQHRPPGIGGGGGGPLHGGAQRMLSSAGSAGSARSARSGTFGEWSRGLTRDEAARTVLEQARALLRD